MESTLSFSCSCSDLPLSRQGATLTHLDFLPPHDLLLLTDGSVPFPFGKGGSGLLANCLLFVALRPLFPFQQAQYVQVFLVKPAPFCKLFASLGSTSKSATSTPISLSFCPRHPVLSFLKLCGRSGRNCLISLPVLSGYNESPDTRFFRATTRLMIWPDGERYLHPLQCLVVYFLGLEAYCFI